MTGFRTDRLEDFMAGFAETGGSHPLVELLTLDQLETEIARRTGQALPPTAEPAEMWARQALLYAADLAACMAERRRLAASLRVVVGNLTYPCFSWTQRGRVCCAACEASAGTAAAIRHEAGCYVGHAMTLLRELGEAAPELPS